MGRTAKGKSKETPEFLESIIHEWRTVFDSITDMVSVLDKDFTFIRVNRSLAEYLRVEPQEVIGRKCHEIMHGTDKPVSYCPIARSTSINRTINKEVYDSTLNRHYMISLSPILDDKGNVKSIIHIMRDITERKMVEIELRESEAKYRKLVETANDAIFIADAESGIILDANKKAEELLGIPLDMIIGMHQTELHPEDEKENYRRIFMEHVREGNAFIGDLIIVHKSGRKIPVDISSSKIELGGKKVLQGVFRDISDRKKAEEALITSEEKYRSLFSAEQNAIIMVESETTRIIDANNAALRLYGYSRKEILTLTGPDLSAEPEHSKAAIKKIAKSTDNLVRHHMRYHKKKDGSVFPVEIFSGTFILKDKKIISAIIRDITMQKKAEEELKNYHKELELRVHERTLEIERTNEKLLGEIHERKEAEEALRASERRFRAVATSTSDLLWEGNVRDNSLNWFGDIDNYLGYEKGKFPRTISGHVEHIHPDDKALFLEKVDQALQTGNDFKAEYRITCKDGSYRFWDETGKAIEYEDGKAVKWVGSVTDITNRKRVEDLIIKSQNQFKKLSQEFNALLDAIPDNIILLDRKLRILWANRATAHKTNSETEAMKGEYCYTMCFSISAPCENCPVEKSFFSGKEEISRRISPTGKVWDLRAYPIKDDKDKVKNVIEVARDISTMVKLEKEASAIQAKLIHTNKMTSLGTLVSGVAHEINNPNSYIMTNADLFIEIWKDAYNKLKKQDGKINDTLLGGIKFSELERIAPELLKGIYDGSVRIKNIIDSLKNFARTDRGDMNDQINLNKIIKSASNILNAQIMKCTNNFHLMCEDTVPRVKGNSQQIEQVIVNLIMNALQALPDKNGHVRISTQYDAESDLAIVKVEDNGSGIPQSIIDRITEPFFTTKMDCGGTGLGLSISYAIIMEHNGSMEFQSVCNEKTVACVKLPACS